MCKIEGKNVHLPQRISILFFTFYIKIEVINSVFGSFLVKERKGRERKGREKKRIEEKGKKP